MTNCCKSSAACPLACYHGAHSSFMELPSVLSSNIIICRPLDGRQTAANRLQHALLLITIAELCPLGPICLLWSSLFSLWSNVIYVDPLMGVKLLQIVLSTASCIPQQTCAPLGSFVFYGAPLGSCGSKIIVS